MSRPAVMDRPSSRMQGGTGTGNSSSNDSREVSPSASTYPVNTSFYSSLNNALGPPRPPSYPRSYVTGGMPRPPNPGSEYPTTHSQDHNIPQSYGHSSPLHQYSAETSQSHSHASHPNLYIRTTSSARPTSPAQQSPYSSGNPGWVVASPTVLERPAGSRAKHRDQTRATRTIVAPQQLNYSKIMHCYNDIMATAAQDAPPSQIAELARRMHLPAAAGVRLFDPSEDTNSPPPEKKSRTVAENVGQPNRSPVSRTDTPSSGQSKRQRDSKTEGQVCKGCDATSTPEWRRGPLGPRTLCNACGLVYAKIQLKRRSREQGGRNTRRDVELSSEGEGSEGDFHSSPSD